VIRTEPEPRAVWGKVIELWTFTSELGVPDSALRIASRIQAEKPTTY